MVVLPFVPVTASTFSSSAGWPNQLAERTARAARASGTTIQGPGAAGARWHTAARAPFSTASARKRWPSVL